MSTYLTSLVLNQFHNTSSLTDSDIVFTLKMEPTSKNAIFGPKLTVKSGHKKYRQSSAYTLFFKTLEKQPCKQKTVQAEEWSSTKWTNESTKINRVI